MPGCPWPWNKMDSWETDSKDRYARRHQRLHHTPCVIPGNGPPWDNMDLSGDSLLKEEDFSQLNQMHLRVFFCANLIKSSAYLTASTSQTSLWWTGHPGSLPQELCNMLGDDLASASTVSKQGFELVCVEWQSHNCSMPSFLGYSFFTEVFWPGQDLWDPPYFVHLLYHEE